MASFSPIRCGLTLLLLAAAGGLLASAGCVTSPPATPTASQNEPHARFVSRFAHDSMSTQLQRTAGDSLFLAVKRIGLAEMYQDDWLLLLFPSLVGPSHRFAFDTLTEVEHRFRSRKDFVVPGAVVRATPTGGAPFPPSFSPPVITQTKAWDNPFRSRRETSGDTLTLFTEPPKGVIWRYDGVEAARYDLGGQFEILPGPGQQVNVLLGCVRKGGCINDSTDAPRPQAAKITFKAGAGVQVLAHRSGLGLSTQWTPLAAGGTVRASERTPFHIARRPGRITVFLRGDSLLSAPFERSAHSERWGLGGENGTTGRWYEVRVDTLPGMP